MYMLYNISVVEPSEVAMGIALFTTMIACVSMVTGFATGMGVEYFFPEASLLIKNSTSFAASGIAATVVVMNT
jgi:hypothetical protein